MENFIYKNKQAESYEKDREKFNVQSDQDFFDCLKGIGLWQKSVADIGSGAGQDLSKYILLGAATATGIEPSLEFSQNNSDDDRITTVIARSESIPLDDNSFDVVVSKWALQCCTDVPQAMSEIVRITKPGGHICLLVEHPMFQHQAKQRSNPLANYFDNNPVSFTVNRTIAVEEPSHQLSEYLHPNFLQHVHILQFSEHYEYPSTEQIDETTTPTYFILVAEKISNE